jgi:hypothetical protein
MRVIHKEQWRWSVWVHWGGLTLMSLSASQAVSCFLLKFNLSALFCHQNHCLENKIQPTFDPRFHMPATCGRWEHHSYMSRRPKQHTSLQLDLQRQCNFLVIRCPATDHNVFGKPFVVTIQRHLLCSISVMPKRHNYCQASFASRPMSVIREAKLLYDIFMCKMSANDIDLDY